MQEVKEQCKIQFTQTTHALSLECAHLEVKRKKQEQASCLRLLLACNSLLIDYKPKFLLLQRNQSVVKTIVCIQIPFGRCKSALIACKLNKNKCKYHQEFSNY